MPNDRNVSITETAIDIKKRGLECPKCGCGHFHVVYTRATTQSRIMRRRECRHCGRRITTYEHTAF